MRRIESVLLSVCAVSCVLIALGWTGQARVAQADNHAPDTKFATVDVLTLIQELLQAEPYRPAREALADEWSGRIEGIEGELQQLQGEIELLPPTDPNQGPLRQRYQRLAQQAQSIGQQASQAFQALSSQQASAAYQQVHAASDTVAAAQGYGMVLASKASPVIEDTNNLATVTQEILARPVLFGPMADDLTGPVRTELGLPDPGEAADAEAAGEAGAMPEDG
jgi:Skp family chaperone for outer membrane proteins